MDKQRKRRFRTINHKLIIAPRKKLNTVEAVTGVIKSLILLIR